ncbi:MAG: MBL fold metallo-hydrolase [Bacteroidaceae bacterium]|jgi:glyoxylase-like metal-dependent hydrolase (beta-lactamase superfamily II)|nr:MBL fold metallo-hydrolase [Bacteroidaceae bacterium]
MKVKAFICNMLHENCYLVYDEQSREAAIIDPGFYWDNEKQQLTNFVSSNELQVKYLLCTHLHFDHIFGVPFIEDTYGVKLSASLFDAPWLDNFVQSVTRFGIRPNGSTRPIGNKLHDGNILTLGEETLECIATPGHSAGGMCFYAKESGMLFAGDTLFQSSIGRTDFHDGDYAQLIRSIQTRLLTLPEETIVFPGHGDTTTIGDEMRYNPYI